MTMAERKVASPTSISINKNKSDSSKDKPKAGSNRAKDLPPPDPESERKNLKAEKLAARSAGKRKESRDEPSERTAKGARKKKKKKESDDEKKKAFKVKRPKQNAFVKFFTPQSDIILRDPRAIEAADALRLTQRHLRRLRDKFDSIDVDGSGNIDVDEFFEACNENKSPITDRLFAIIDLDGSGTIEFDEYVRIMATYCMYTKDEILRFCFETFDKDGSNGIDEKEFMELCK
jgi:Ca2+-binding EF-hand superfamily protein